MYNATSRHFIIQIWTWCGLCFINTITFISYNINTLIAVVKSSFAIHERKPKSWIADRQLSFYCPTNNIQPYISSFDFENFRATLQWLRCHHIRLMSAISAELLDRSYRFHWSEARRIWLDTLNSLQFGVYAH